MRVRQERHRLKILVGIHLGERMVEEADGRPPFSRIEPEAMIEEILSFLTHRVRNLRSFAHSNFEHYLIVVLQFVPRPVSGEHLEDHTSDTPYVGRSSVTLGHRLREHLGSHVRLRSHEGIEFSRHRGVIFQFDATTEITEFQISIRSEKYVGAFDVPMNDAVFVKDAHRLQQLPSVLSYLRFGKSELGRVLQSSVAIFHKDEHLLSVNLDSVITD